MSKGFYKLLWLLIFIPCLGYANDAQVLTWTRQTLSKTLCISYQTIDSQLSSVKTNYTLEAWQNLKSFLGDKIIMVRDNRLTLHPKAVKTNQLVAKQGFRNIIYWRVNQGFDIPELKMMIYFSVIVIPAKNPPYLIQSLNVTTLDY
ncbi:hypothetical protein ACNVED_01845 [Legionella sp. D16C41]|uniref:hypothetical protein n=1 Tax=Legionella sp. D16C41 TaxID=3402688 RepID=UPI003AF59132